MAKSIDYIKKIVACDSNRYEKIEDYNAKYGFEKRSFFHPRDSVLLTIQVDYPAILFHKQNFKSSIASNQMNERWLGNGGYFGYLYQDSTYLKVLSGNYTYVNEFYDITYDKEARQIRERNNVGEANEYKLLSERELKKLGTEMTFKKVYFRYEGLTNEAYPTKNLRALQKKVIEKYLWPITDSMDMEKDNINMIYKYVVDSNGQVQGMFTEIYDSTTKIDLDAVSFKRFIDALHSEIIDVKKLFIPAEKNGIPVKSLYVQNIAPSSNL
ncbi:MAG: hypothetical protein ACTJHT_06965 [Sphingobacterium sp.]|uniref:hypothetical protein n=1 Tax=Sphingobacterium sp. JB170 TaxID=1434842 RepID=UPI00117B1BB0|nr:hypothetical protein [Sphingobacterium sp. JB170]